MSQLSLLFVEQEGSQMRQFYLRPTPQALVFRPENEFLKQTGIRLLRLLGLAALIAQVLEKILDQLVHHNSLPVNRRYASRYFCCVLATTSGGRAGAGGVLFQVSVSR